MEEMETQAAPTNEGEATTPAEQNASTEQPAAEETPAEQQQAEEGAPEKYEDFTAPEGRQFDPEFSKAYSEAAKELNLNQDKAQKFLDKLAPVVVARQQEQINNLVTQWGEQATVDKEYGGEKLQENLGIAKQALDKFGTPEFKELIQKSGLGNHPEVIRFIYRVGKSFSPDSIVTGRKEGGKTGPKTFGDLADALYS